MKFYAIRHIPSGDFVPAGGKGAGGHTKQPPSPTRPPRLFETLGAARKALTAYLKGQWEEVVGVSQTPDADIEIYAEPQKGTARNPSDWEIVPIELKIGKP